ncbi:MAG TPA: membrane protein insertase YidC, partial [Longimicrobiaceae bacterium]|nr:membrane protein insertase YidC [Longimicrobiaceae bacterium]
ARPAAPAPAAVAPIAEAPPAAPARTVTVRSPLYEYRFSTRGAALTGASLLQYESYARPNEQVQLVPSGATLLGNRVVLGRDTLDLASAAFEPSAERLVLSARGGVQKLTFRYGAGGVGAEVTYTFRPESYLVDVEGRLTGLPGAATVLTSLGTGLAPHDAPEHGQERELSAVGWNRERIERLPLRKVRGADTIAGPLEWAGIKDRYFLVALVAGQGPKFARLLSVDAPDERYAVRGKAQVSPRARTYTVLPVGPDGRFAFQAYLGPQEHDRLVAVGHELEEVNPYGYRWLRPVVRPIAAVVLWVLKELHDGLGMAYGWVLVIFGVMMRVVLWPLNAKAMRAQMRNMAVQPQLQARMKQIQETYRNDPAGQQRAMIETYRELGVSPFSMLSGCLPMLIPMPVLITLFFVFQSAIEFRGEPWGWLPDLSLKDPWFILPIFLMASMFALSWVSNKLSGIEQNPQMKMMMWMMPIMMGVIFWALPSGLNLYYATTNIASIPQQVLVAKERRRAIDEQKAKEAQQKALRKGSGPPRARQAKRKG